MEGQTQIQRVTTKDLKKVEVDKRFTERNLRKREERARLAKSQSESKLTYYGAGAAVAIRALSIISYYVYQLKKLWLTKLMKLWLNDPRTISLKWSRLKNG